ncbi:DUF4249 family protein [Runella slithyformis]|uniref:DUF4249 family protein n=1 Tax=Runella slithyformis (strain ATCC 29530 / DSM 19594 / LMG 11500 / NCIMB 11436 / LSU 4) TaxID=761193 RepID=A0A7U4E7S7_RUNSL|nr:DUF4249 family protein [Runella slithyformis]AEI50694.1 hypothetical protein Runsl_4364 [Runella slithyformis DSM 19594]
MKFRNIVLCIFLALIAFGCVEVNSVSPKVGPKFAVIALISPTDSLITVFVSAINPLGQEFKASDMIVKNAKVRMSSGKEQLQLLFVDSTQRYQAVSRTFVRYGTNYDLLVEIPNQLPLKARYKTLKEISPTIQLTKDERKIAIEVSWNDTPEEANIYSLSINYWNAQLRRISSSGMDWEGIARTSISISDKGINQSSFTTKGTLSKSSSISDTTKFTLLFYNIDQATSDFFNKRSAQYNQNQANQQSIIDFITNVSQNQTDLNTFFERFKEPVLLPTNVENGLGFFGGYYQKRIKID